MFELLELVTTLGKGQARVFSVWTMFADTLLFKLSQKCEGFINDCQRIFES